MIRTVARELFLDRGGETGVPKRKGLCQIWTTFFVPENSILYKKGLRQISTAFVTQKIVLRGAHAPPTFRAYGLENFYCKFYKSYIFVVSTGCCMLWSVILLKTQKLFYLHVFHQAGPPQWVHVMTVRIPQITSELSQLIPELFALTLCWCLRYYINFQILKTVLKNFADLYCVVMTFLY